MTARDLQARRAAELDARRDRRLGGDGGLGGRSGLVAPRVRSRSGGAIAGTPITMPEPLTNGGRVVNGGETISLEGSAQSAGGELVWSARASRPLASGFALVDLPTIDVPVTFDGYYDLCDFAFELAEPTGATVTVYAVAGGGATRIVGRYIPKAGESWSRFGGDLALGVLNRESVRIVVDEVTTGQFRANLRLVERSAPAQSVFSSPGDLYAFSDSATRPNELTIEGAPDIEAGDLLVAMHAFAEPDVTTPAGWTNRLIENDGGDGRWIVDTREADAGDDVGSWTWTAGGGTGGSIKMQTMVVIGKDSGAAGLTGSGFDRRQVGAAVPSVVVSATLVGGPSRLIAIVWSTRDGGYAGHDVLGAELVRLEDDTDSLSAGEWSHLTMSVWLVDPSAIDGDHEVTVEFSPTPKASFVYLFGVPAV